MFGRSLSLICALIALSIGCRSDDSVTRNDRPANELAPSTVSSEDTSSQRFGSAARTQRIVAPCRRAGCSLFTQADSKGNLIAAGHFDKSFTLGDVELSHQGELDFFIVKYDSTGQLLWVEQLGGPKAENLEALAVDGKDNIVAGFSIGPAGAPVLAVQAAEHYIIGKIEDESAN